MAVVNLISLDLDRLELGQASSVQGSENVVWRVHMYKVAWYEHGSNVYLVRIADYTWGLLSPVFHVQQSCHDSCVIPMSIVLARGYYSASI